MNTLANAFAAAGLCSTLDAELAPLSLSQLKKRRNEVIKAALSAQGASYNRGTNGQFRSVADEQAELLAINKAIHKLKK